MTEQEVRAAYPEAVPAPPAPPAPPFLNVGRISKLGIKNFLVEAMTFTVSFFFDDAGKLDEVVVKRDVKNIDELELKGCCLKLEELLTRKYGPPALREWKYGPPQNEGSRLLWNPPGLGVILNCVPPTLYVSYKKP
jgi:hypothetical protein